MSAADDLAVSIEQEASLPDETWQVAAWLLIDLARLERGDAQVLRALARRERAREGVFPVF